MPLYCKVAIKQYGGEPGEQQPTANAALGDLAYEAKRLVEKQEVEKDPALVFKTPQNVR